VLALADVTLHCGLLATRGRVPDKVPSLTRIASASLRHAHPDTLVRGFRFRSSTEDVAALAAVRSLVAVVAWGLLSSRANLFRPYLLGAYGSFAAATALVLAKAPLFRYRGARGPLWLAPLLFSLSLLAALGHVALASSAAAASRRRRAHLESCSSADECWALPGASASGSRPAAAHRRRQSREDVEASLREAGETDMPASALADADSCFAEIEGASVHYKHLPGDADAADVADAAVVLLHAFGGGEHSWRQAAPLLARRCRCRVIAFDRAGFGLSGRPAREHAAGDNPYTLRAAARVAVALCRQLGVRRVALVGHADGATLALLVAALLRDEAAAGGEPGDCAVQPAPLRCCGLALLTPSTTGEVVPTSTKLLLKSSVGLPLLRPLLRSEVGEAALRRGFASPARLTPAVLARYAEPLRVVGWDRALWEVARCAGEVPPAQLLALAEAAGGARTPALLVAGALDRLSPPDASATLARALGPAAATVLLPECGSLPHEEQPAALVAVLSPFIAAALQAQPAAQQQQPVLAQAAAPIIGCAA
jgi:magnesium chelatase accessory protein